MGSAATSPTAGIDWLVSFRVSTRPDASRREPAGGSERTARLPSSDLVILGGETLWTNALANALRRHFGDVPVIIEDKEATGFFLRRRIRRLGLRVVIGQVALGVFARLLRPLIRRRERAILASNDLDATPIRTGIIRVASANDPSTTTILDELAPKVVVVSQTRILSRRVLASVPAIFINIHTGMTPQYRGMHGAYWALLHDDAEHCGVTVHIVDAGIDTGPIVAQARIEPTRSDSYFTYHWAQLAAALPLVVRAVEDALAGKLSATPANTEAKSELFYHPTLWAYVWGGLRRGVW
jgi:folate-dependent phosphoribosylglycinamide formyltransferase PurN